MFFPFFRDFAPKLPISPNELAVSGICTAFFDTLLQMQHQRNDVITSMTVTSQKTLIKEVLCILSIFYYFL